MAKLSVVRVIIGLLAALLALAPFAYKGSGSRLNNLRAIGTINGLGASLYEAFSFSVNYPAKLRIGESDTVVVEIRQYAASEAPGKINHAAVSREAKLRLSASGFEISPSETIGKRVAPYDGAATWIWAVSPRSDHFGHQQLVLSIDGVDFDHFAEHITNEPPAKIEFDLTLNGTPQQWSRGKGQVLELPVYVVSQFGVPQQWVWAGQTAISLASFFLLYPVVVQLLGRKVQIAPASTSNSTPQVVSDSTQAGKAEKKTPQNKKR